MNSCDRYVIGLTHVDLGWKKGRAEMAEILDVYLNQLTALIEKKPDFHYLLEQALHYKDLKSRKPALFEKIKTYVKSGNLEFATGLASTIENNVVNGESFVRNMQIGLKWLKENFDVDVATCAMIDTFGFPPQIPQVLNQFGYRSLLANRLGGRQQEDVLLAKGLDGSTLLVVGRDINSAYVKPGHVGFQFYMQYDQLEKLFQRSDTSSVSPYLIMPYTENEWWPTSHIWECMDKAEKPCRFGTLKEYLYKLEEKQSGREVSADLNPEFTGTYSLRHRLRIENRKTEQMLLEAEKLCAICGVHDWDQAIEEAWWELAYTQFHDIITGSHPTPVYLDCIDRFHRVYETSKNIVQNVMKSHGVVKHTEIERHITLFNGLPFERIETVRISLPESFIGVETVEQDGQSIDNYRVENGCIVFDAHVKPLGTAVIRLIKGEDGHAHVHKITKLENEYLLVELGGRHMIDSVVYKPTGAVLFKDVDDLLVLQRDIGNYQIEQPVDGEIPCGCGDYIVECSQVDQEQTACIRGNFPEVEGKKTGYIVTLSLRPGKAYLDIHIQMDWRQEAARLRLKLPSQLKAAEATYEVPFGVAKRQSYGITRNSRGEWPAHRFVAVQDVSLDLGMALINRGTAGVEQSGGTLYTTLLRAPHAEYAGMVKDDTSSDHGNHSFDFRLAVYSGSWEESQTIALAQTFNQPFICVPDVACSLPGLVKWDDEKCVLSAIKHAPGGGIALRFYETTGHAAELEVTLGNTTQAWTSNVKEMPLEKINCYDDTMMVNVKPFEIKTVIIS